MFILMGFEVHQNYPLLIFEIDLVLAILVKLNVIFGKCYGMYNYCTKYMRTLAPEAGISGGEK